MIPPIRATRQSNIKVMEFYVFVLTYIKSFTLQRYGYFYLDIVRVTAVVNNELQ